MKLIFAFRNFAERA